MEVFLIYLLKSGAVLALFLVSYQLFLKKETFFKSNRIFLAVGLISSFIVPLITFTRTILIESQPFTERNSYSSEIIFTPTHAAQPFNWIGLIVCIYVLGIAFFSSRLLLQLRALRKIKKNASIIKKDNLTHVKTEKEISPFSFFKYIFYNPQLFKRSDLRIILDHEKVHANQLHSLDILLSEMILILLWFNPIIWLYRKSIKENLEYLADAYTCADTAGKKHYQYLLLQKVIGANQIPIVNPFFNSLIKKRIVMLNQNQSKKVNLLKLLIVLPFVAAFLMAFNIREEVKFSEPVYSIHEDKTEVLEFQSPLNQKDIKRISARFGQGHNKLEKDKFHNGIDLVATTGTKVLASNSGTVKISSNTAAKGNYIVIEHQSGYSTQYMHLQDRSVKSGAQVKTGTTIGHVGNTGKSTGPHLHFEILKSDKPVNPESLVAFKNNGKTIEKGKSKLNKKQTATAEKVVPTIDKRKSKFIKKQTTLEEKVELIIDKDTSDESLLKMKKDLAEQEIDFSYTRVHNEKKEIIDITIQVTGKAENGGTFNSSYHSSDNDGAISPLVVFIDQEQNLVSIGSKGDAKVNVIKIRSNDDKIWVDSDDSEHKEIRIKKVNGKNVIIINGEEVGEEDHEDMDIHLNEGSQIFISKKVSSEGSNVFIQADSENNDIKVVRKRKNGFFMDFDGARNPLYIIDGKESSSKMIKKLDTKEIENVTVLKGEKAIKKYGKKAKDGVVAISTKKN